MFQKWTSQILSWAVDQTEDAIVITDIRGNIQLANPAFERMTGYSRAEFIGKNANIVSSQQHSQAFYEELWQGILSGRTFRSIFTNKRKNGELFYIDQTITPIKNEEGVIFLFMSIWKDITDRKKVDLEKNKLIEELKKTQKKLEESLTLQKNTTSQLLQNSLEMEEGRRKLEEANEKLRDFVTIVTHDLRGPVSNSLGFIDILLESPDDLEIPPILERIKANNQKTLDYMSELLELTSLERGKLKLHFSKNNFLEVAKEVLDNIDPLAEKKKIQLINKVEDPFEVMIDNHRIVQVLSNLLTNAIKFTPRSGKVILEAEDYPEGLRVKVIDNGVGIPHEKIPQLLDKFAHTHTAGTEGEGGTGWGLPLCEDLLEAHGTTLDISSELDVGSTFAFLLPHPTKPLVA